MNVLELFEKYEKAANVVVSHYSDVFIKTVEDSTAPDEFKEFARQQHVDEETIAEIIENAPRGAFDVFDKHEIYIEISVVLQEKSASFIYFINDLGSLMSFPTRKEAEAHAVEAAFRILNEKLCQIK
jgi:hypothetical protein